METAALIPIKRFRAAKARLAPALTSGQRERLARWLAEGVVDALRPMPTFVACDDDEVATWAESHGAEVLWGPGLGLNGAIDDGVAALEGKGVDHVLIAHGDLPFPAALTNIPAPSTIVLVPDRRRDGTNVIARPTALPFRAAYGAGSFDRHLQAALRLDARIQVRIDDRLAIDIDTVADIRHPAAAAVLGPLLQEATTT